MRFFGVLDRVIFGFVIWGCVPLGKRDLPLVLFSFVLLICSALVVAILSFAGVYFHESLKYFFYEGRFGTFYPAALLGLSSLSCFFLHVRDTPSLLYVFRQPLARKNIWFWCGFAFAYLSLDDLLEIHEKIDIKLHHWMDALFGIKENAATDKLDDLIVAVVLAAGIWFLLRNKKMIAAYPAMLAFYVFACGLVALMVVVDFLTNGGFLLKLLIGKNLYSDLKDFLMVVEESLKIFACSFILLGSVSPWLSGAAGRINKYKK